jgi:N-acetylglucosamine kinase-like BadF-type ATPase
MSSLLLVESGSTKTDWCLLRTGKKPQHFKTSGINPNLQRPDEIKKLLKEELDWKPRKHEADAIVYYGAGAGSKAKKDELHKILKGHFGIKDIEVQCDMMAAARALCGEDKGIVAILGTGSNSCYYNGKKIADKQPSLGFIAGDEGSGNYLGKRVLQYYAYKTFDAELNAAFEQMYGNDLQQMIYKLYHEPFPNRYLASFVALLVNNRGHYMVENIVEDCLNDFFHHHILKYRQSWKLPLYFTGAVAHAFEDVIQALCGQYELEFGKIEKSPMDGLVKYHKGKMK